MALDTLAVDAQRWAEDEFRRPDSAGVKFLRRIADEVESAARADVPRDTGRTLDSIEADERTGRDGIRWFKVSARNPQTDVLDSASGYIRNRGAASHELTRTGRHRRARGTGTTVRASHPFMRTALVSVYRVEGF